MIEVDGLTKVYKTAIKQEGIRGFIEYIFKRRYEETKAVDNISFQIKKGEFVGFIGPNGAGKTTTIKMLSGILYPTKGKVEILGFIPWDRKKDFLKKISFISGQRSQLFWELPATDFFKMVKKIYELDNHSYHQQLSFLVELLQAQRIISKPVKTLSLGERIRAELIGALLYKPQILFLDEPTIGLDIISQESIRNFLKTYNSETKATIILTSHYLKDVENLASRLTIINKGKIIYDGSLEKIKTKYSELKTIKIILSKPVKREYLSKLLPNSTYQYPVIKARIRRERLHELFPKINALPYIDISIDEIQLEEIISKMWKDENKEEDN